MSFQPPILDDRTFQQIVDEVRKRIPRYCPEWTDHNLSDPGITLIELFAWMTELLIYRLNQVPQLHYIKFAEFLGLQRPAPRAAEVGVTFWLARELTPAVDPSDAGLLIAPHTQVSTTQTETEAPIIFTTNEAFTIHAPQFQQMLVEKHLASTQTQRAKPQALSLVEVQNLRDGKEPLPMFSPKPLVDDALYFGFGNDLSHHIIRFDLRFRERAGIGINVNYPPYLWEVYADSGEWVDVEAEPDSTKGLNAATGSVTLHLPKLRSHQPEIGGGSRRDTLSPYWVRVRIKPVADSEKEQGMREYNETPELLQIVKIAAVGCLVPATHVFVVKDEKLGVSDGTPGQRFRLSGSPVLLPLDKSERLKVKTPNSPAERWEEWEFCQDFSASEPTARHFGIDSNSGELRFGPAVRQPNGEIRCYGAVPPRGAELVLKSYRYGGGAKGNLPKKVINILRSSIPYVAGVENRYPSTGGLDAAAIEELSMAVQRHLRTHRAAVTPEDFEAHVYEKFGNEVDWVRCVAFGKTNEKPADGRIRLLLVPTIRHDGTQNSGKNDAAFFLSDDLLEVNVKLREQILEYLQEFRLLTDRVAVEKPSYQRVTVSMQVTPEKGVDWEPLRHQIVRRLYAFFHPVTGGIKGDGWHDKQPLSLQEVEAVVKSLPDVEDVKMLEVKVGEKAPLTPDNKSLELTATELLVAAKEHDIRNASAV